MRREQISVGLYRVIVQTLAIVAIAVVSFRVVAATPIIVPGTVVWTSNYPVGSIAEAWVFEHRDNTGTVDLNGIVVKPLGTGPFPGVVLSHGRGGNAVSFATSKSELWFAPANYITIAVNYTHAGQVDCSPTGSNPCGGSQENVDRATLALDILRSQQLIDQLGDVVNRDQLFLYGNSMGAMVTVELAQTPRGTVTAAAITAGGIYAEDSSFFPYTPSGVNGVATLNTPLMQIHGRTDTVVPPSAAQTLSDALDTNGKVHQMVWNSTTGHSVQSDSTTDDFVLAWFDTFVKATAPRISQLSKRQTTAGNQLSVRGTGFGSNTDGNSLLNFNSTRAAPFLWSDTLIKSDVPSSDPSGYVEVIVPVGPVNDPKIEQPAKGGVRSNRRTYAF